MAKRPHTPADGYEGADTTARVVLRELTEASDRRKDHRTFDRILEATHEDVHGSVPEAPSSRAMPTLPRVTLPMALRPSAPVAARIGLGNFVALGIALVLLAASLTVLATVLSSDDRSVVLARRAPLSVVDRAPASMAAPRAVPATTLSLVAPEARAPRPRPSLASPAPASAPSTPPPRATSTPNTTTLVEEY
jgi:hypothetical protein